MVQLRDARYCNLKLLLMFLVIYGHLIEPWIWQSQARMTQYRWIYLFHMPLFCFLSGLFLHDSKSCGRQFRKMLFLYFLLQTAVVLLGDGKVKPFTPYWHLWYLFSYSVWAGLGWIWFCVCKGKGKIMILVCAVLAGCGAGLIPSIGRALSLSRTLVFFPYFWLGLICDPQYPWQKLKWIGLSALGMVIVLMRNGGNQIPVVFLYQAAPYGAVQHGVSLRLTCYLLGVLICVFLLSFTPRRRFPFTRAGADTMPAYLAHAPIVRSISKLDIPWQFHLLTAAVILYAAYKLLRWHSRLYGIVPAERRDSGCLPFKKSMKNTPNQFIGSYYP